MVICAVIYEELAASLDRVIDYQRKGGNSLLRNVDNELPMNIVSYIVRL
jgi:hypothetical protein